MDSLSKRALKPGTRIDAFVITRIIGHGAFGITYEAEDQLLKRRVALKEYYPLELARRQDDRLTVQPMAEEERTAYEYGRTRFLDEARTLAQFQDPHIVRVHSFLAAHGTAYLVMDYEDGMPLSQRIRQDPPLDEAAVTHLLVAVLQGLAVVHAKDYLHRDIKPGNIIVRPDGSPVLLDFGAARQAMKARDADLTVVLTPGYAPFEQYSHSKEQGPPADLYAVAATAVHCLTRRTPIAATERISAQHEGHPDPLHTVLESLDTPLSPEFLRTLKWALEPFPNDRPQSALAFREALRPGQTNTVMPSVTLEPTVGKGNGISASLEPVTPKTITLGELDAGSALSLERRTGGQHHFVATRGAPGFADVSINLSLAALRGGSRAVARNARHRSIRVGVR